MVVVLFVARFSSFEEYDDTKKSTFCTINFCLVEDLTEEGSPMAVGHDVASASAVVAVGKTVDVTCTAGYWPKEVPDSAHYAPFDAFGEGKWWDEQAEVFQATCVPPMGFFNYSGPVCAPVQCEATDLLDGAWTASNGFTVSFGEKYVFAAAALGTKRSFTYFSLFQDVTRFLCCWNFDHSRYLRSTAPALPAVNRTQNVSIICDPTTHRETADSSEPPQFSCDTPFSFISERTGLNDTHRAATGYACEPIECSKADLLSGHWRAGYVASPVTMSPLFQRSSGSVMALLEVDSISCDEDAG